MHVHCAGFVAFLVGFGAVCVGWALSLDYSAKLFVMTFVLVVMGSNEASGGHHPNFFNLDKEINRLAKKMLPRRTQRAQLI